MLKTTKSPLQPLSVVSFFIFWNFFAVLPFPVNSPVTPCSLPAHLSTNQHLSVASAFNMYNQSLLHIVELGKEQIPAPHCQHCQHYLICDDYKGQILALCHRGCWTLSILAINGVIDISWFVIAISRSSGVSWGESTHPKQGSETDWSKASHRSKMIASSYSPFVCMWIYVCKSSIYKSCC